MQGLWSAHRRGKINLNSAPPTPPVDEPVADPLPVPDPEAPPTPTINGKRKVRSSRTEDSSSKRPKISGGGAIAKDHTPPTARLADLGGIEEIYLHTGVQAPRGVLLHGPPGSGKTLLANAIAGELGVPFISISAPSIVSGMSGESEKTLRDTFEEARLRVAPCLLFIDEIDAITPKRESAQREMERRIVAQFLTCMDEMSWDKTDNKPVIVMGATNRPDSLDAALRRAGRFDHEISMGVPDEAARAKILQVLSSKLRLDGEFDFTALAKATPGYVGADLAALTGAAGIIAVKRIFKQLSDGTLVLPSVPDQEDHQAQSQDVLMAEPTSTSAPLAPLLITPADFLHALKHVQPSAQREGFATVPDVTWADIGALHATRDALQMAIVLPLRRPLLFRSVGIAAPCGVLLWGPPGCGKTLLAKAVANESQANFISVKGPELLNKYVGESERAVRQVFARARASSPCVIFFDELDCPPSTVVAATNRPDMIDPAMVRPGRLDKLLYVDLPAPRERGEIMRTLLRGVPVGGAAEAVEQLVQERCEGYSGADLAALVREAGVSALRRTIGKPDDMDVSAGADAAARDSEVTVTLPDFGDALDKVGPSVSAAQRRKYEALRAKFAGLPVRVGKEEEEKRVDP
ncbi:P-loop containing nucleoside triphosphate hydrolase protein [Mycena olivaceomarginata]|nr:P-loop containing nucleoside triphosphate hydrolase protein [Mycena olivaceomarginata]